MAMRDILDFVGVLGDEQFQKNQLHTHARDGGRGDDRPSSELHQGQRAFRTHPEVVDSPTDTLQ
jgi:hypothetical protein